MGFVGLGYSVGRGRAELGRSQEPALLLAVHGNHHAPLRARQYVAYFQPPRRGLREAVERSCEEFYDPCSFMTEARPTPARSISVP